MTLREQLLQEIQVSTDRQIEELWNILQTIQASTDRPTIETENQTILERMGGMPTHTLSSGNLHSREDRKQAIGHHLRQRHDRRK